MADSRYCDKLCLKSCDRDLTILVGEEEKPYHYYSMFLAAQSDVIDTMLVKDTKEKKMMTIRFPDISVEEWEAFEPYIYPNSKFEFKGAYYVDWDVLPIADQLLARNVLRDFDRSISHNGNLFGSAGIVCKYGIQTFPKTNAMIEDYLKRGHYGKEDVSPSRVQRPLDCSDLKDGKLCFIFEEHGYIPPKYKNLNIKDIIRDEEKLTMMMYYKKLENVKSVRPTKPCPKMALEKRCNHIISHNRLTNTFYSVPN